MTFKPAPSVSIELKNIELAYGNTPVIKDVSLHIEKGEFFAFLGPSGCGKSTLLRLIAGFEQCQRGEVYLGDEEVSRLPPWKRNVGMVFQNYALWPHMTIFKNVSFGLEERKLPHDEITRRTQEALELVGLQDYAERRPNQLSGGQQQRVALARTLVIEPKVLLLDEPLSNLDAKLRIHMRQELLELQRKLSLTTIFVTHDQEEANTTADRIAVIKDGRVQQIGTPMHLYDHPTNLFVAQFLGSANVLKGMLRKIDNSAVFETDDGLKVPLATAEIEGSRSLVLRPQNITLCPTDAQPGDLQGKVHKREFLGNIVRYDILVGQQHLIVDEVYGQGQKPAEAGQSVALKLDHQHILIMDAE